MLSFIPANIFLHLGIVVACFFVLAKSADVLVEGAVGIAYSLKVPKIIVGIVLVGFMTTAPEFTVSMISALRGEPEIALGNAVGSVIVDDSLAWALGVLVAPAAISVDSKVLRTSGFFLIGIDLLTFGLSLDGTVSRIEGLILLAVLVGYLATVIVYQQRSRRRRTPNDDDADEFYRPATSGKQLVRFVAGIAGVLISSEFLVNSAQFIAAYFGAPPVVIGLTLVAIGTSIPEIATCIVAARKGHGDLAFGDILGADILNILWIVGATATATPLAVGRRVIFFSMPAMIVVVATMLLLGRLRFRFTRWKGAVLVAMYLAYLTLTIILFHT